MVQCTTQNKQTAYMSTVLTQNDEQGNTGDLGL